MPPKTPPQPGGVLPTPPGTGGSRPTGTPGPKVPGNRSTRDLSTPSRVPPRHGDRPAANTGAGVQRRSRSARAREDRQRRATSAPRRPRDPNLVSQLEASDIPIFVPGQLEYERAVASSNLLYRFSRPTYVIRPQNNDHVTTIVQEAVQRNIPITIKNGGHSYAGHSYPNDGIMLDMKDMNAVDIDREHRTVTIQAGALWGMVYRKLIDEGDGLMVNGGRCPTVGVSGFLLGGGIGPFSRSFGMGSDNLKEMSIVTAPDGDLEVVTAEDSEESHEGMLFWALCGAGGGNFGVVVELKIHLHELPDRIDEVVAGRHTWFPDLNRKPDTIYTLIAGRPRPDESTGLLATMNHFYVFNWPERMTIDTSWFSDLSIQGGAIAVRFLAYFAGDEVEFDRHVQRGVLNADLRKQITRRALPERSTRFLHETLFAQWDEELKRSTPNNSSFRVFHSFCFDTDPDKIAKITAIIKEELESFKRLFEGEPSGLCQVSWIHAGGETTKRDASASAFRWRNTVWHTYIMIQWTDKWLERDMRGFARKFKDRLRQYSLAGKAAFVNFPDASLPETDHLKAYYGNNRQKLQQVKRIWDEHNFFQWEQGVDVAEEGDQEAVSSAELNSGVAEGELSDGEEETPDESTDLTATMDWDSRASTAGAPLLTGYHEAVATSSHDLDPDMMPSNFL